MTQSRDYSERLLRGAFYFCSVYFLLMGALLIFTPEMATRTAGEQNPLVTGMLRGAGGSIVPYSLLYIYVARRPREHLWGMYVIGFANVLAIILDLTSIYLAEYTPRHAMLDIPVEALSLTAILVFQMRCRKHDEQCRHGGADSAQSRPPSRA